MKTSVLSVLLLAMSLFAADPVPQAGQPAPDFTLPSQDGSKISLHDFKGKWVVLYFYPKDQTPGCTIEAHNFQRDLAKYEQNRAVIVGVSGHCDELPAGRRIRGRWQMPHLIPCRLPACQQR